MKRRTFLKKMAYFAPTLIPLGALAKKPHPHGSDLPGNGWGR